jgi:hypothetical protein
VANSFLGGPEQAPEDGEKTSYRLYDDLVVTYRVHARIQLALQGSFGTEQNFRVEDGRKGDAANASFTKNPRYFGAALWARWQFAESTYIALRGEGLHDEYGVLTRTGARNDLQVGPIPGQRLLAGTVTLGWQPHPRFLVRVEAMHRVADQPYFAGGERTTYEENDAQFGGPRSFVTASRTASTSFAISAAFSL